VVLHSPQDLLPGKFVKDVQSGYKASDVHMHKPTTPKQLLPPECPDASALQLFLHAHSAAQHDNRQHWLSEQQDDVLDAVHGPHKS
jgi:hypothetical protein